MSGFCTSYRALLAAAAMLSAAVFAGCATESHRIVTPETVTSAGTAYNGPRYTLVVAKFQNRSTYMQGIFSEGDHLGNQAKTILKTHLQNTGRFILVDRENMKEIAEKARMRATGEAAKGAQGALARAVRER